MRWEAVKHMGRIYMDGIRIGQVIIGRPRIIPKEVQVHILNSTLEQDTRNQGLPLIFFRCVRDNKNSGKKYPYLSVASSGVTIVSRDADGGVDPTLLFASGDTPDTSNGMNKIAPKLLIGNTSLNGKSWAEAKAACESIGAGWRLPTQCEMYMIVSLGGTKLSLDNQGFGASADWGTDFQKNCCHALGIDCTRQCLLVSRI